MTDELDLSRLKDAPHPAGHVSAERYCYAARDDRGLVYAVCVDDPRWLKETAESLAMWIKEGASVERMTKDHAIAELNKWTRKPAPPQPQQSLLLEPSHRERQHLDAPAVLDDCGSGCTPASLGPHE